MSQRAAFGVLAAVQVTLIAAITVVVVALPDLRRALTLDEGQAILVSSGYGLSFGGLLLLGARLGGRWGLRRCLLTGLTVLVAGSVAGGVAEAWPVLIGARLAQGVGAAFAAPGAMGLLMVVFPEERGRERALATWGVLASVGATAGMLAGGALTGLISWRWCFFVVAAAGAAEAVAAGVLLPASPGRGAAARLDVAGALAVTGAVLSGSFGLIQTTDHPWTSPLVVVPIAAGMVLLSGFALIERRATAPLVPPALLGSGRRVAALGAIWITSAATATVSLFCSLYFQQVQGRTPLGTTARLVPLGIVFALAAAAVRPGLRRFGPRNAAVAGLGVAAFGLGLLSDLGAHSSYGGPILAGMLIFPAAASFAFAAGTVAAVGESAPADVLSVVGLANLAMETGPTVGLALLVGLAGTIAGPAAGPAAAAHGYGVALRAGAAALLIAALAAALFIPSAGRTRCGDDPRQPSLPDTNRPPQQEAP